ncbi:hypothetical protein FHX06_007227 [Rhizobium sp. BK512]|uniref:hypothetical protein n=1 Tax=Rhizobium sp. BK512 TaxID=2587010 RepID=UPI0017EB12BE|nr:hypothetical protein [Rhizobium sp. BK512]MBB3565854.1 hypothetical protein [Rhizobium sp. BK512]
MDKRYGKVQGGNAPRVRTGKHTWNDPFRWQRQAEKDGDRPGAFGCEAAHVNFPDERFGKHMRGKGTKVGDNWTLPLLPEEHRTGPDTQHKIGHEQAWWESHGIDANTLADRLWRVSGDTAAVIKS